MNNQSLIVRGGSVLDVDSGRWVSGDVLCRGGHIEQIGPELDYSSPDQELDATGQFIIPGLIDCHVHVTNFSADVGSQRTESSTYVALRAAMTLSDMLDRGFTSVRDLGGADFGLAQAQAEGLLRGPRLFFGGKALSQTGGHGDFRRPGDHGEVSSAHCCSSLARLADGIPEVRKAVRDEIRKGAHHIKVMASGGVGSETDRLDSLQYSHDELLAIVDEAKAAKRYVAAHAYTDEAVSRALKCGVRSIEHGNFVDKQTLDLFKEVGAFLVPTMVTYFALREAGAQFGLPTASLKKVETVLEAGLSTLEEAHNAGIKLAFGTDLMGPMQGRQLDEFALRLRVQPPLAVLQSATSVAAELLQRENELGRIAPGALADFLILNGDPLEEGAVLADISSYISKVVQSGVVVRDRTVR